MKQTRETVKRSSVFKGRLHHRRFLPSTLSSACSLVTRRLFEWNAKAHPERHRIIRAHCPDSLLAPHDEQHTEHVRQQRSPVVLDVQAVECLLCPIVFPQRVRSASEARRRREALLSAYSHRTPCVSSLQRESPSARTPSLYVIHRKMAALSIARSDTNSWCLDLSRQCMVSFSNHRPFWYQTPASSLVRRRKCGLQRSSKKYSALARLDTAQLFQHRRGGPFALTGVSHR